MSAQFQRGLKNMNPSIKIQNQGSGKTSKGNEMSWFDFKGYSLDGQSFNQMCLIRMWKIVLHGIFSCMAEDKIKWEEIVAQIFSAVEEEL